MNKVMIVGRLASDPYKGETASNVEYSRFTVVVRRQYTGTNNEPVLDFIPCVAWRQSAEFVNKFLEKGSLVSIEGSFQSSKITASDGKITNSYSINVDHIETLESREAVEARKKNSNTKEFSIPMNSNTSQNVTSEATVDDDNLFDQLTW